ncbi:unnamed protein product, partial [Didymodactylos carnosus]
KPWLNRQYRNRLIVKPDELEKNMQGPTDEINSDLLDRIQGSMTGMALGDALGAFVEFRPRQFLVDNPVKNLQGGGTWGLQKGQFTDDTSMALCLANSLIARRDFVPYDQLVRYKWWFRDGYMSSTGQCFDIGSATKQSLIEFENRQKGFAKKHHIPPEQMDFLSDFDLLGEFNVYCSREGVAGNGALMRLAPVPLFFQKHPLKAVAFSGFSGVISHGDRVAFDACRYYGALIVAAVHDLTKNELLDKKFYLKHEDLFSNIPVHPDIMKIAEGSYQKKGGYDKGIRGKGYIASALEAALWAFWSEDSFEKGALAAVNLGDDTDTTAAIYGQLAGAHYGYNKLPKQWLQHLYAHDFIQYLSKWIGYEGQSWKPEGTYISAIPPLAFQPQSNAASGSSCEQRENWTGQPTHMQTSNSQSKTLQFSETCSLVNQKHKSNPNAAAQMSFSIGPNSKLESTTGSA